MKNWVKCLLAVAMGMAVPWGNGAEAVEVTVTNVTARQRYPWNGLVDIDYEVSCSEPGTRLYLSVSAKDEETGKALPVRSVKLEDGEFGDELVVRSGDLPGGKGRLVWDAGTDVAGRVLDSVAVEVNVLTGKGLYLVVDLSSGNGDEAVYPVSCLGAVPEGGWTDEYKTTNMVLRWIPSGTFSMGSPLGELGRFDNEDLHTVTISKPFYMGVFEVSQKQYNLAMAANPSIYKGDARPVESVSYSMIRGAQAGANWPVDGEVDTNSFLGVMRRRTGLEFDLPTEAQLEYACRAGTTTALNSGKNLTSVSTCPNMAEVGRYSRNQSDGKGGYSQHTVVGSYLPNAWGLYDLHGNVWEWCLDWYVKFLGLSAVVDPVGGGTGTNRTLRGGRWNFDARYCRSADRSSANPSHTADNIGFRLVCPADVAMAAVGAGFAAAQSGFFKLDTREGRRLTVGGAEEIAVSGRWEMSEAVVFADGMEIGRVASGEEETVLWEPKETGGHVLRHESGAVVMDAGLTILREGVELHTGREGSSVVWGADKVHVVDGMVTVGNAESLTIEEGAVVKFTGGSALMVESGGTCVANGVIFTHIADDTVGGDTLDDGYETVPVGDAYSLSENMTVDSATEFRYLTSTTSGTLNGNTVWMGNRVICVTGNVTVASGATLTVMPGAVVKIASGKSLTVNKGGTLNAIGTRAQPIVFTSMKDDEFGGDTNGDGDATAPQAGDWGRIYAGGTVEMDYCRIRYCNNNGDYGAIHGTGGTVRFDDGIIEYSVYECVRMNSGRFESRNSVFRESSMGFGYYGGSGVYVYNGVVADCTIACRASNKHFYNTVFYRCQTFLESTSSSCSHCLFFNPAGYGAQSASQVRSNGNIWGDPLFLDADGGDFRVAEGSPCVDAGNTTAAPETDYFGQPRASAFGDAMADIGIYEVQPRGVAGDVDLVTVSVSAAAEAMPGGELRVSWKVGNRGGKMASGARRDEVSLVSASGRVVSLGEKVFTQNISAGGTEKCEAMFRVPAMAEGTWWPKVVVNSQQDIFEGPLIANNARTGDVGVEVSVPETAASAGASGTVAAGVPTVLKLHFEEGDGNRMVVLDVPAGVSVAWGFGFVPQGTSKSGGTTATAGTPVQFLVPESEDEMDVYVVLESETTGNYELSAESTKLTITGVTPGTLPSSGMATLTIAGAGFGETNAVTLVGSGASIRLHPVERDASGNLVATVDCSLLAGGATYAMHVESDGREAACPNAVTVAKVEGRGILEARLTVPDSARQGRMASGFIEYSNTGNADMAAPIFKLSSPRNGTLFTLRDGGEPRTEAMLVGISPTVPAGILKAGETARVSFQFRVVGNYDIRLSVLDASSERPRDSAFPTWDGLCKAISDAATALSGDFRSECDYGELYDWAMRKVYGQGTGIVRCMLLDINTEKAIPGATWAVLDTNDCVVATGTADHNGCFAANQLDTNGVYRVSVAGWQDDGFWFRPSTPEALEYHYYAAPYCDFAFSVKGGGDDEAAIFAIDEDDSRSIYPAERQTDGTYRVENLPDGTYAFLVTFAGGHAVTNDYSIKVENGVAVDSFARMEAFAAGRAEVAVQNEAGVPVADMPCLLQCEETGITVQSVTDGNGIARFSAVPGYYVFMSAADAYAVADGAAFELAAGETARIEVSVAETPFCIVGTMGAMPLTSEFTFTETNRYGPISLCRWDFDADGTWDASGLGATNTYEAAGDYGVRVGITLDDGSERVFPLADAVRVWEEDTVVVNDGTLLLDESSGWVIDEITADTITLAAIGTVFPAAIYPGQRLVDPNDLVNPREVLEIVAADPLHIEVKTRVVPMQTAYKTLRVSAAAVRATSKSIFKDILARPFGTDGDITVAHITGKHYFNDWISIEPAVDVIFRVAVDCHDGELLGLDFSVGVRGNVTLAAGNTWDGKTKNKWIKRSNVRKNNAVTKTLPFIDENFLVGVAPIHVVVRLKGEIALEGSITANLNLAACYTWRKGRGGKPSFNKGFDLASIDAAGSFYVRGGPELYAALGIGRDVNGKPYGISALDLSVWGGLMAGLEANVKGSEFEPNDYSAFIGPFVKVESWLMHVQLGGKHEHSVFEWVGLKNEFGIRLLNVDLHYPDFPGLGGTWKTPMPSFTCTQTSLTDTRAAFKVASTTSYGEESELSRRSWDFGDRADAAANWEVETSFPVIPDDVVVYDIILHEAYKNTAKALNWLPAFDKKAVKKLTVKGRKKQDDGRWSPDDPVVEIEDWSGSIPQSRDPNEIAGPLGAGVARYVAPGTWMTYTVYFENKSDATAAAQEVYVTEQLSGALDWSTFEVVDVGFNNQIDLGLGGKRRGASETAMTGTVYKVRTTLDFDGKTGTANWYMRIVDEATETRWPKDVFAGFLPPNDETGRGEGHITYRVKVRDDAAAGAIIRASASIVFDYNAAIETDPSWWNTVAEMGTATVDLGNGVATNVTVMVGAPWGGQLPDPGKRQGMRFAGWFTGPNGTGEEVTEESLVVADAKLYAFWDASAAPELWLDVSWGAVEIGTNGVVKGYAPDGNSVEGSANRYVLTGTSRGYGVKFEGGSFTNTWTNLVIDLNAKDAAAIALEGAKVEVELAGDNSVASGEDCAGIQVDAKSALVLQGTGRLVAGGGKCGAGIGGGKLQESGRIEIRAGTVEAYGGEYGAGIGGGLVAPAAETVVITGGSVKACGSDGGKDIGGGFGRENTGGPVDDQGADVHGVEVPLVTDELPVVVVVEWGDGRTYRYEGMGHERMGHEGDSSLWFWLPDGTYEFEADGEDYGAHVTGASAVAVFTDPGSEHFQAPAVEEVLVSEVGWKVGLNPAYRTTPFDLWTATKLDGAEWAWEKVSPEMYRFDAETGGVDWLGETKGVRVFRFSFRAKE